MVVLGGELEDASGEKRCQVAGELLDAIATIPTTYLRAISSPLLFHLAGIGHILGSVIEGLSQSSFRKIRHILLRIADLLEGLESGLRFVVGANSRLRSLVERIDQFIITNKSASASRRESPFANPSHEAFDGRSQQSFALHPNQIPNGLPRVDVGHLQEPFDRISPSDVQLPSEMLQDWPWPFDPVDDILFPDILSGWTH